MKGVYKSKKGPVVSIHKACEVIEDTLDKYEAKVRENYQVFGEPQHGQVAARVSLDTITELRKTLDKTFKAIGDKVEFDKQP